ncbi:SusC/RagA family TonB-linked outer membrane protein [Puia dinghuensis]|uniref:SusC/RagA family TonB-linked outer membrane protein n=1 Tax=Puia dinghuensis TaxID=1792502 RepID=A0A8J2UJB7_9BACT|nr:SusC/RagA family TonB-linked outer membrane protein [Puia dinghuensis]
MTALLLAFSLIAISASAQLREFKGRVVDKNGAPVPFASLKSENGKFGVSADENGYFTIRAKVGDKITASGVDFAPKTFTITETNETVNIVIDKLASSLEQVVVTTALGIKRQAKELGYSTTRINAEELNQAKVTNIATGLAAKVSGLQINLVNNGVKPDVRITLRGNRSILGNNQALLVVDDIPLPISSLASLAADDIESVNILKGASASALYGSQASNGVVIVTTKKGRAGKPQVALNTSMQVESIAYTANFQNQFGQYGGESPTAPGLVFLPSNPYIPYVPYENQNYGPRFNGQLIPIGAPIRIYRPDGSFYIKQDSIRYSAVPNAKKGFFDNGITWINAISYGAGDEKSKFFLSVENLDRKGIIPKDHDQRTTIRLNGSRTSGIFRADYTLGYTLDHTSRTPGSGVPFTWGTTGIPGGYSGGGSYFQNRPLYWTIINSPADVDLRRYRNWQTDPFASPDGYFNAYYGNPWWQIDQTRLDEKSTDIIANISLGLQPWKWLNLQYRAGIARNDYNNKYTQAGYTFAPWAIADTLQSGNIPSSVKVYSPSEGDAISYNQRLTSDFLASVHQAYGSFDFKFIAGTSLIDNTLRLVSESAGTLVVPNFYNISNRVGIPVVGEYKEETRLLGVFGDLTVGYNNYAFLHGSLRNDWTSLLASSNRSYLYPAVDASFVFTEALPILRNNRTLSFGKVSAAYSRTAQVSIGAYSLQNTFNSGGGFPFGNVAGYTVNGAFANPNIKPEFSTDYEARMELGFLRNRINFIAAYYHTLTNNQTIPITISPTTGFTSAFVNSGEMVNQGVEFDLRARVLDNVAGWTVELTGNYSYNKNTVKSLGYGLTDVNVGSNSFASVGDPYPIIKTSDWTRDPSGHIVVDATTGYPTLDPNQKKFGTTNPPHRVGLTASVNYKGFRLAAVADGRFGAVIFNSLGSSLDFTGVSGYSVSSGRQPFIIPNSVIQTAPGKYVPNTNVNTQDGNLLFWANVWNTAGSTYVNSADFWKLREVTLTYTFPRSIIDHLKIVNGINVSVFGRNLLTWRAKDNVWSDPEFSNTTGNGIGTTDINQLPPTKIIGFNLNVIF